MAEQVFLAVDLGASSGRVLAGLCDGQRLRLEEVHRFENGPVDVAGNLYWDALGLWTQIKHGLRAARAKYGAAIKSIGVDSWGVDFALLGPNDVLLGNPFCYREPRNAPMPERAYATVPRAEIFAQTGLQFMQFNSLFQLLALRVHNPQVLDLAESFLMIADFYHWLLTGVKANEVTNATTTQFFNPVTRDWARGLLERLNLPTRVLGKLVEPGTSLGPLRPDVAAETGLTGIDVVVPGTHDTASAVMGVPAKSVAGAKPDWCYISSGTWALMGVEVPKPVVNDRCRELNFTNEGGVGDTIRLLKNITGLWLVQECRRVWDQAGQKYSWDELTKLAAAAPRLTSLVNPDDSSFQAPGDMPSAIREFCRRNGQTVPESPGAVIRTAIESVALKCRYVLGALEELIGGRLETIHMIGGGVQNRELCQATADACGRRVVAGPIEATAIGNVLVQAIAAGTLGSIAEARACVARSFPVEEYTPHDAAAWDEAYGRFKSLI